MLANFDYKRIILAILLVMVSGFLLLGIIWLVFIRQPSAPVNPDGTIVRPGGTLPFTGPGESGIIIGPGGTLPGTGDVASGDGTGKKEKTLEISEVAGGSLTKVYSLAEDEINEITLTNSGFNYLSGEDNKFYRISFDGSNKVALSDEIFAYVEQATWSNDGNQVILEYPDGANIIYDFTRNKKVTLPTGAVGFSFSSSGDDIAYKFIGPREEDNWLVVSDNDSNSAQAVEPLGDQGDKVQVAWSPAGAVVALYHDPIGLNREEVFFVGQQGENFKSLVVEGSNFQGKWSPDGKRILYHVLNSATNYNPVLWISDAQGDSIGHNNFNLGLTTWVDKCVFADQDKIYCAVPVELAEGTGLYPDLLADSPDVFYEINLNTGIGKLVAYPVLSEELAEFQAKKLFISDDGSKLYFWDGFTDKLYYLRLK